MYQQHLFIQSQHIHSAKPGCGMYFAIRLATFGQYKTQAWMLSATPEYIYGRLKIMGKKQERPSDHTICRMEKWHLYMFHLLLWRRWCGCLISYIWSILTVIWRSAARKASKTKAASLPLHCSFCTNGASWHALTSYQTAQVKLKSCTIFLCGPQADYWLLLG